MLKIDKAWFFEICIGLCVFICIFLNNDPVMIVFAAVLLVNVMLICNKGKIRWNTYFSLEGLFIIYSIFQVIFGITSIENISFGMTRRLLINFFIEIALYNLLISEKTPISLMEKFAKPYIIANLVVLGIMAIHGMLLSGSINIDDLNIIVAGIQITVGVKTTIGYLAACAFAVAIVIFVNGRKRIYAVSAAVMFLLILLSGTRKVILLCFMVLLIVPIIRSRNYGWLLRILGFCLVGGVVVFIIMKTPYFYSTIGVRIERMMVSFINGEIIDKSVIIRMGLSESAKMAIAEKPFFGWGLSIFKELYGNGIYSHNNYLEILFSCGYVGGVIFFSRYLYLLIIMIKGLMKTKDQVERYFLISNIIIFLCLAIMEYWQVTYYLLKFTMIYVYMVALTFMVDGGFFTAHQVKKLNRIEI